MLQRFDRSKHVIDCATHVTVGQSFVSAAGRHAPPTIVTNPTDRIVVEALPIPSQSRLPGSVVRNGWRTCNTHQVTVTAYLHPCRAPLLESLRFKSGRLQGRLIIRAPKERGADANDQAHA